MKLVLSGAEIESLRTFDGVELRIIEERVRFPDNEEEELRVFKDMEE